MTWGSPFRWDTCSRPSRDLPRWGGTNKKERRDVDVVCLLPSSVCCSSRRLCWQRRRRLSPPLCLSDAEGREIREPLTVSAGRPPRRRTQRPTKEGRGLPQLAEWALNTRGPGRALHLPKPRIRPPRKGMALEWCSEKVCQAGGGGQGGHG